MTAFPVLNILFRFKKKMQAFNFQTSAVGIKPEGILRINQTHVQFDLGFVNKKKWQESILSAQFSHFGLFFQI